MDTLWADISYFQPLVNDTYPYKIISIRANDGAFKDSSFIHNYQWAVNSPQIEIVIVYCFYRPDWLTTLGTMKSQIQTAGGLSPKTVLMIDVEGDNGKVSGNQSAGINNLYEGLSAWIGDRRRVFAYGNVGELNSLWPQRPSGVALHIDIASYGSNPNYPGKFAHQFADDFHVPPFGLCDINSADGMSIDDLKNMFGVEMALTPDERQLLQEVHDLLLAQLPSSVPQSGYKGNARDFISGADQHSWVIRRALDIQPDTPPDVWHSTVLKAISDKLDALPAEIASKVVNGLINVTVTIQDETTKP